MRLGIRLVKTIYQLTANRLFDIGMVGEGEESQILTGSVVGHKALPLGLESWSAYVRRVFYPSLGCKTTTK